VNDMSAALLRIGIATDAADVLDAACAVFEGMLALLRRYQEDDESAFPAFALATCAAANGRDWTGAVWAPRAKDSEQDAARELLKDIDVANVAHLIAAASGELAARLSACAIAATDEADRNCCEHAAAEAATIRALMGGANPP
jgi:hypothetical protein